MQALEKADAAKNAADKSVDVISTTMTTIDDILGQIGEYNYRMVQENGGQYLRVANFATVSGRNACDVRSFQISSRKKHKTWMSVKLNILCLVCINLQQRAS